MSVLGNSTKLTVERQLMMERKCRCLPRMQVGVPLCMYVCWVNGLGLPQIYDPTILLNGPWIVQLAPDRDAGKKFIK